jgi:hypothetical protein
VSPRSSIRTATRSSDLSCTCEKKLVAGRLRVVRPDPDCRQHGLPAGVRRLPHLRRHARVGEDDRQAEARLYAEATRVVYRYVWGNNPRRAGLRGRECVVDASGALGTVLVRFLDTGERVTTSYRALRRLSTVAPCSPTNPGGT